jgi:hypothetical protein
MINEEKNGVDPNEDCGTFRCIYRCEDCPFGIPDIVDSDSTKHSC